MSDPTADADPEQAPDNGAEDAPEPFANRAARRGKNKKGGSPAPGTDGRRPIRSGTVQSPRQYGTRRSG